MSSLQEQLRQAGQRLKLQTLTAPVDGTVQQLAIHTEGGVVTPAQALLTIVPAGSPLEIEANISNRDIGFVHAGQEAAIKVDTFNFTKYGLLSGSVDAVSQDAVMRQKPLDADGKSRPTGAPSESSEPMGQELVYVARIKLDQAQMNVDGKLVNLTPSMAVTAEIKTGQRRLSSICFPRSPATASRPCASGSRPERKEWRRLAFCARFGHIHRMTTAVITSAKLWWRSV